MSVHQKIDWKKYTKKQRMEYIWDYYRYWILVILICVLCIGYAICEVVTSREPLINVIMLNSEEYLVEPANAFDGFLESYGYAKYDGAVSVVNSLRFIEREEMEYQNYQLEQYLFALVNTGEQEVFFGNDPLFMTYVNEGMLVDLRQIIPDELLNSYKDMLIYSDYWGPEERFPCAIRLINNRFIEENHFYDDFCYVGVFYNSDQPEIAADFLEFLLQN